MNPLNLSSINLVAPYTVWGAGEQYYYFKTEGDGKQAMRNRLFARWFEEYSDNHLYYCRTVELVDQDNVRNFAALIVQKSNPRLNDIIAEFEETIRVLTEKPEE